MVSSSLRLTESGGLDLSIEKLCVKRILYEVPPTNLLSVVYIVSYPGFYCLQYFSASDKSMGRPGYEANVYTH